MRCISLWMRRGRKERRTRFEDILIQKAGHCDLVETQNGEWYAVHLCGRASEDRNPADAARFAGARRYMLGRETAIQKMHWTEDGWLVLEKGGNTPECEVKAPACAQQNTQEEREPFVRDDFDGAVLDREYQSLRVPMDGRFLSLAERPGWLRMYGRSGLSSRFSQTLIARRMTEYVGKCITLLKAENKKYEYLTDYIPLEPGRDVVLGLTVRGTAAQFSFGYRGETMVKAGPRINAGFLSDEACQEGWFTGTMIGICCQDLTGFGKYADFDWFTVKEEERR